MSSPKIAAKSARKPKPAAKKPGRRTEAHRKVAREGMRRAYHAMSAAEKALLRFRKQARPPTPRAGSVRSTLSRVTALAMAYCDWSDIEEVVRMYVAAAVMTELTGTTYVVDHVVPLNHPLVCGLHTHTNLAVVSEPLNMIKGNWIWPDMWPHDESTLAALERLADEQQQDRLQAANHDEHSRTAAALGHARARGRTQRAG